MFIRTKGFSRSNVHSDQRLFWIKGTFEPKVSLDQVFIRTKGFSRSKIIIDCVERLIDLLFLKNLNRAQNDFDLNYQDDRVKKLTQTFNKKSYFLGDFQVGGGFEVWKGFEA